MSVFGFYTLVGRVKKKGMRLSKLLNLKISNYTAGNCWLSHHTNLSHAQANKVMIRLNETVVLWRGITLRLIAPSLYRD